MRQPPTWSEGVQRVLNGHPVPPGKHRDVPGPIDVRARVVFADDGEVWLPGRALEWTAELVRVEVHDPRHRLRPAVAWLPAGDVRRRF